MLLGGFQVVWAEEDGSFDLTDIAMPRAKMMKWTALKPLVTDEYIMIDERLASPLLKYKILPLQEVRQQSWIAAGYAIAVPSSYACPTLCLFCLLMCLLIWHI
jgi:hypothetical protein